MNPGGKKLGEVKKSKLIKGRMKIADSPIPVWTKEWDKIVHLAP
jgi:hypothetical protein